MYFLVKETRRNFSDFHMMLLHHIVTILLVILGVHTKCYDISVMVSQIHDVADVILEFSKILRHFKFVAATKVCSIIFCATWIYTRCIVFPIYIIFPYWNGKIDNVLTTLDPQLTTTYGVINPMARKYGPPLVFILFIMNVIWALFIVKITLNIVFREDLRDIRDATESKEDFVKSDYVTSKDNEANVQK